MADARLPHPALVAALQRSPRDFDWAAGLLAPWQHEIGESEWTPNEQVYHLLAVETGNYHVRIPRIINEDRPTLVPWDNDATLAAYDRSSDIKALAAQFTAEREKTVAMFEALSADQWARTAIWPDGAEVDLAWLAEKVLWHALDHLALLLDCHQSFELLQARRLGEVYRIVK